MDTKEQGFHVLDKSNR